MAGVLISTLAAVLFPINDGPANSSALTVRLYSKGRVSRIEKNISLRMLIENV